jgi:3-hydroxyisobutyrate dehydrogenase-like beta-hydroxyacid dehydrogenase
LRQLYPRIVERDFRPRAYVRQLAKDIRMVEALTGALGMPAPMLGEARRAYDKMVERGFAELDSSAVVKMYETAAASEPTRQGAH